MASFTTSQAGSWTDPATWGEATEYPGKTQVGDTATINHEVNYDWDNSSTGYAIDRIYIDSGGGLIFDTDKNTYLKLQNIVTGTEGIYLNNSGFLQIGTEGSPLSSSYTAIIDFTAYSNGNNEIFQGNGGLIEMWGMEKTIKGNTTSSISASGSDFTMSSVPTDWAIGDELAILPTGNTYSETDYVSIVDINGTTVETDTFTYSHLSGAVILNLTRNIIIRGNESGNKPGSLINWSNGGFELHYVRGYNQDSSVSAANGAFRQGNQTSIATRPMNLVGVVADNNGSCGFVGGQGYHHHKDCISINNSGYGFGGGNDIGRIKIENCYYVDNALDGMYPNNRGYIVIYDSTICGNGDDGIFTASNHLVMVNCKVYANADYGLENYSSPIEMYNCYFGESDIGTQENGNADFYFRYGARIVANDCKFSSTDLKDGGEGAGWFLNSTNHNQVGGAIHQELNSGDTATGSIYKDTSTYRTSSPSIRLESSMLWGQCHWSFPIKVSNGDTLTVSIYGKSDSATGWETNPSVRLIGCGIDDNNEWAVADTNWNELTVSGTASRDGIVVCNILWGDDANTFWLDDITASIT